MKAKLAPLVPPKIRLQRVDRMLLRGWAITGVHGAYYSSLQPTRSKAIRFHCSMLGKPWDLCKKKGDRCERVEQHSAEKARMFPNSPGGPPATCSAAQPLTLTIEEIRHLALFSGIVVAEPTANEKEDERETEVVIAPWPTKGVKGDDGMLPPHRHIAYLDEYPEEGCVPLGSPNAEVSDRRAHGNDNTTGANGGSLH